MKRSRQEFLRGPTADGEGLPHDHVPVYDAVRNLEGITRRIKERMGRMRGQHMDKKEWGEGPWQDEPDKVEWRDPETELPCLIVRNGLGALCGYVGIHRGHPWFAKGYSTCIEGCGPNRCENSAHATPESLIKVHGGLTYSDFSSGEICHTALPGETKVWWFGFDCAHAGDYVPGLALIPSVPVGGIYRSIGCVEGEVTHLAEQLAEVGRIRKSRR
jgi:hypothetical protein